MQKASQHTFAILAVSCELCCVVPRSALSIETSMQQQRPKLIIKYRQF